MLYRHELKAEMSQRSIFNEEWRRCLREHYKYVVRQGDTLTEKSLQRVLYSPSAGFTEDELKQLYLEATLRTEDLPDGFVPDIERTFTVHPAECQCTVCQAEAFDITAGHNAEGQPLSPADAETTAPAPVATAVLVEMRQTAQTAQTGQLYEADLRTSNDEHDIALGATLDDVTASPDDVTGSDEQNIPEDPTDDDAPQQMSLF